MAFPRIDLAHWAERLLHLRNRHFFLLDVLFFLLAPSLALYLRTDTLLHSPIEQASLLLYTAIALVTRLVSFYSFGLYQRYWRFVGSLELLQMGAAMAVAMLCAVFGYLLADMVTPWFALPRSLPVLDAILAFLLAGLMRASVRLTERVRQRTGAALGQPAVTNVLIVGAGYTGALLAREIRTNQRIRLRVVGFVDDDPTKHGMTIHGAPVLGGRQELPTLLQTKQIERVLIAMPMAPGVVLREIVNSCQRAGVTTQTMPGMHELLDGSVSINRLRNVQLEDLLRRAPIQTDTAAVRELIAGKRVLVTGGGGSIGSEICRQILRCQPAQLILVGHGENSIFEITNELRRSQAESETRRGLQPRAPIITPIIADLRFRARIVGIFQEHRPQVVFHAAAHKHVPLMEANAVEAITNNVLGTRILLEAAQQANVERFVMISTDKAVNPTNVMGASKRTAEFLVLQAAANSGCFYQVVRFGNVLGSRGSVIHTFRQQIANGGPVLVTHPEMVRYFMTIPEAVQLVLQAAVIGHGGAVLMLDMGNPVRIVDLAQDMITLSGLQAGSDITIEFSGLRPGEKLFEEMFTPNESYGRTNHAKILVAHNASQFVPADLNAHIDRLIETALQNDEDGVLRQLQRLLPEYRPWEQQGRRLPGPVSEEKSKSVAAPTLQPLLSRS